MDPEAQACEAGRRPGPSGEAAPTSGAGQPLGLEQRPHEGAQSGEWHQAQAQGFPPAAAAHTEKPLPGELQVLWEGVAQGQVWKAQVSSHPH